MFPRRGAIALVTTAIALVLLFNFKTPDQVPIASGVASTSGTLPVAGTTSGSSGSGSSSSSGDGSTGSTGTSAVIGGSTGAGSSPATGAGSSAGTETLTGTAVQSRYGTTQVQVTITNGQITAVSAVQLPTGGRSGMISQYVEPILSSEALTAQSANIDIVSGATYTSEAYAQSLQSALDQAAVATTPAG